MRWTSWTTQESKLLSAAWRKGGINAALKALPHRSRDSIESMAYGLKLRSPRLWTAEEKYTLRIWFPVGGADEAALYLPHRSRKAIVEQASRMKIRHERDRSQCRKFSAEQEEIIARQYQRLWPGKTKIEIAQELGIARITLYRICKYYVHDHTTDPESSRRPG